VKENIDGLRKLFPESFTESSNEGEPRWKVDFETLKQILGDYTEQRQERYSFSWNGKSRARLIDQTPSTGTLRLCLEESVVEVVHFRVVSIFECNGSICWNMP
jgi:adenine-specific DNA-methyltransferase